MLIRNYPGKISNYERLVPHLQASKYDLDILVQIAMQLLTNWRADTGFLDHGTNRDEVQH